MLQQRYLLLKFALPIHSSPYALHAREAQAILGSVHARLDEAQVGLGWRGRGHGTDSSRRSFA